MRPSSVERLAWFLLRKCGMGPVLLRIHPKSALLSMGWFRSFRTRTSVDRDGHPVPWWTYSSVHFVAERLTRSMRVLEFGSGSSTIWLAQHTQSVVSFENSRQWADRFRPSLPSNASIVHADPITSAPDLRRERLGLFDVVVIDADADRIQCADAAMPLLSPSGVVIWDDTDGPDWPAIRQCLRTFREISFTGLKPQEVAGGRTTVFYRSLNCLDI